MFEKTAIYVCNSAKGSEWLSKHKCKNIADNVGLNQNHKLYKEKVVISISTNTISTIIKSLPDAPDLIDDEVSWRESGMKKPSIGVRIFQIVQS